MGIVLFMLVSIAIHSFNGPLTETEISPTQRAPFLIALIVLTGATFMAYRAIIPKNLMQLKRCRLLTGNLLPGANCVCFRVR
jgi:hypothetical protein